MARQGSKDRGVTFKNGGWWVRLYRDGREIWKKCDSKSQARSLYGKLKGQIREDQYFPKLKKREPFLFQTVALSYADDLDANPDRRRKGDDRARVQYWVDRFGKQDVETITTSHIEQAIKELRAPLIERSGRLAKGQQRSHETARRYFGTLHAILERARRKLKETKVQMMNPASDVRFKKADNTLVRYLSQEQETALFAALPPRFHPLITVALHTGMRQGELFRLRWSDVDWFAGTIKIQITKADTPRHAPMNSIVQGVLSGLKQTARPTSDEAVFPFDLRYLRRAFERAVIKAGLTPFRFHDLRHTFASRLSMLGVNDRTLKVLGGWASTSMLDRYSHLSPSHCWQAVEGLVQFGTGSKIGSTSSSQEKEALESAAST